MRCGKWIRWRWIAVQSFTTPVDALPIPKHLMNQRLFRYLSLPTKPFDSPSDKNFAVARFPRLRHKMCEWFPTSRLLGQRVLEGNLGYQPWNPLQTQAAPNRPGFEQYLP